LHMFKKHAITSKCCRCFNQMFLVSKLIYECFMIMRMLCKSSYARLTPEVLQQVPWLIGDSRTSKIKARGALRRHGHGGAPARTLPRWRNMNDDGRGKVGRVEQGEAEL